MVIAGYFIIYVLTPSFSLPGASLAGLGLQPESFISSIEKSGILVFKN